MEETKKEIAREDCIKTYGGRYFSPVEPEAENIDIGDIAHALSLLCRGNGQVTQFFSVGQHCLNCAAEAEARGYSRRVCLACLLHDASEAYMTDVTRPLKRHLPEYKKYENILLDMIYEKYLESPLTEEEQQQVKQIDDDMLYYDLLVLLNEPQEREKPEIRIELKYEFVPFEIVEARYLEAFYQLSEGVWKGK